MSSRDFKGLTEYRIDKLAGEAEWEITALCRSRSTKAAIAAVIRKAFSLAHSPSTGEA
jgi:hypothetical protein